MGFISSVSNKPLLWLNKTIDRLQKRKREKQMLAVSDHDDDDDDDSSSPSMQPWNTAVLEDDSDNNNNNDIAAAAAAAGAAGVVVNNEAAVAAAVVSMDMEDVFKAEIFKDSYKFPSNPKEEILIVDNNNAERYLISRWFIRVPELQLWSSWKSSSSSTSNSSSFGINGIQMLVVAVVFCVYYSYKKRKGYYNNDDSHRPFDRRLSNSSSLQRGGVIIHNRSRADSFASLPSRMRSDSYSSLNHIWTRTNSALGFGNANDNNQNIQRKKKNHAKRRREFMRQQRYSSSSDLIREVTEQEDEVMFASDDENDDIVVDDDYDDTEQQHRLFRPGRRRSSTIFRQHPQQYLGPAVNSIDYFTMTPPPTWEEASRQLMIADTKLKLKRRVSLKLKSTKTSTTVGKTSAAAAASAAAVNTNTSNFFSSPNDIIINNNTNNTSFSTNTKTSSFATLVIQEHINERDKATLSKQRRRHLQANLMEFPVSAMSVHAKQPTVGSGVLEIYPKEQAESTTTTTTTTRADWMEHTFSSAAAAAQFQIDLLGLQILGPSIHNMYQALAVVHKGSLAYAGNEPVLHHDVNKKKKVTSDDSKSEEKEGDDKENGENGTKNDNNRTKDMSDNIITTEESGIAWDDLMRCLGCSFPSVKQRLEDLAWLHFYGPSPTATTTTASAGGSNRNSPRARKNTEGTVNSKDSNPDRKVARDADAAERTAAAAAAASRESSDPSVLDSLESMYVNKRLLLGPVDFFRLFVPTLTQSAIPQAESSAWRVEQMLRLRKRVARASVLVQAYTRARIVSNQGWHLGSQIAIPDGYFKRRLAFDDNMDNRLHDILATDEYYEATVSRDVSCHVRGREYSTDLKWWKFGLDEAPAAVSAYQGFTLVGIHSFHWQDDDKNSPLHYTKDPVQCIPSLRNLIKSHPDLDFFVHAIFLHPINDIQVKVFVRSLPKGVDLKFDKVVDRFFKGDEELRKRKLEALFQLGVDKDAMTFSNRCLLSLITFFTRISLRNKVRVPQVTYSRDRTPIPAINLSILGDTYHFGGALQTEPKLPKNYVSSTLVVDSQRRNSLVACMMISYISSGYFGKNIADFSYNLAGEDKEEYPERILCTSRLVRVTFQKQLPMSAIYPDAARSTLHLAGGADSLKPQGGSLPSLYFKIFVSDPMVATVSSLVRAVVSDPVNSLSPTTTPSPRSRRSPRNIFRRASGEHNRIERASVITSSDPFEQAVNALIQILDGIRVPVRRDQLSSFDLSDHPFALRDAKHRSINPSPSSSNRDKIIQMSVLRRVSRLDIQRFLIASNCSLKTTAVRVVESAAWRGMTFPIDTRTCRVELQNGQFFQQGKDLEGNPVYYFRNTLLGPWRKNEDAVIAAVLHRLETSMRNFEKQDPLVRCTLIVVMGKPYKRKKGQSEMELLVAKQLKEKKKEDGSVGTGRITATTAASSVDGSHISGVTEGEETAIEEDDGFEEAVRTAPINNPRIPPDEQWHTHSTKRLIERLVNLIMMHYPERLSKVLVVTGHGNRTYIRSAVGGVLALASLVHSSRTREKVKFLTRYRDLHHYVPQNELVTLVGGTQQCKSQHFECT